MFKIDGQEEGPVLKKLGGEGACVEVRWGFENRTKHFVSVQRVRKTTTKGTANRLVL